MPFDDLSYGQIPPDILQQQLQDRQGDLPMPTPSFPGGPSGSPEAFYQQEQEKAQALKDAHQYGIQKGDDLELGQRLVQMFDPNVPKPVRQFIYKEMSRQMGVDPAGQTSKEVGQMLMGLDPEAMDNMRRAIAAKIPDAKPGEVSQLVKGVLTGQVNGMQMIGLAKQSAGAVAAGTGPSTGEGLPGGDPTQQPTSTGADLPGGGPYQPGADVTRRARPTGTEVPPVHQQTDPQLLKALGLNPTQQVRNSDLLAKGYTIPTDAKTQREVAEKVLDQNSSTVNTALEASKMYQLFKGKPEVLGVVGSGIRLADQVADQSRALLRFANRAYGGGDLSEIDEHDSKTVALAKDLASKVAEWYKNRGIEDVAVDSAKLQSAMINMAYSMAIARGIPGNRMTNAIVNQHLTELGSSHSVAQFEAALSDTLQRAVDRSQSDMYAKLGKNVNIDVTGLTDQQIAIMAQSSSILPPNLRQAVIDDSKRRKEGGAPATGDMIEARSPTLAEEERLTQEDVNRKQTHEQNTEQRAQAASDLAQTREQRQYEHEKFTRDQALLHQQQEQRRYDLALRKEDRAAEHQRRQEIMAAFAQLGHAIASSGHAAISGGGGGGGGDQNPDAFKIGSAPQRHAPQPIDASRFQRGK